jgi:hypothetical protein
LVDKRREKEKGIKSIENLLFKMLENYQDCDFLEKYD